MVREPEPFRTNFASGDYDRARIIAGVIYAGAIAGAVLAAAIAWWGTQERHEVAAMQENLIRVQQQSARLRIELQSLGFVPDDQRAVEVLTKRVEGLNRILDHKGFSWTMLLNDLESSVPRNVSLQNIQPDLKTGVVRLQGVALTLRDLTTLMTALEQSGRFTDVFLQQQKTADRDRVEFSIQTAYRRTER